MRKYSRNVYTLIDDVNASELNEMTWKGNGRTVTTQMHTI